MKKISVVLLVAAVTVGCAPEEVSMSRKASSATDALSANSSDIRGTWAMTESMVYNGTMSTQLEVHQQSLDLIVSCSFPDGTMLSAGHDYSLAYLWGTSIDLIEPLSVSQVQDFGQESWYGSVTCGKTINPGTLTFSLTDGNTAVVSIDGALIGTFKRQ